MDLKTIYRNGKIPQDKVGLRYKTSAAVFEIVSISYLETANNKIISELVVKVVKGDSDKLV